MLLIQELPDELQVVEPDDLKVVMSIHSGSGGQNVTHQDRIRSDFWVQEH